MTRKFFRLLCLLSFLVLSAAAQTSPTSTRHSDRDRLVGAWRLIKIELPGTDGKTPLGPQPTGMLIYTRGGHMSVQLMYPGKTLSNEYVEQGYEASFGSYDVDESHHLVTHHIQGSVTRGLLVGRDLPRRYQFTRDGHLLIRSAQPEEHWLVTWEKY
jgi:Lipocalin-like domain